MSAGLGRNKIAYWPYLNILPLGLLIFVIVWDTFLTTTRSQGPVKGELQKSLYSVTAFLIWTRVIHLMKSFTHTAHLMRMSNQILYRIRWLIAFILISLVSFGFTYFYVTKTGAETPFEGVIEMFNVLVGQYDIG
jgi:hypothetical protein